jgi:glycoside/pentoside/hexuronide:cation symporter, GPH family
MTNSHLTVNGETVIEPSVISSATATLSARSKLTLFTFYGAGEAATSLVLNGLNGFALLYYTDALGLSPQLAGLALSISLFWEAITEPVMGHTSDRTKTRFGARFPWILAGGLLMALVFYFLWAVPVGFRGGGMDTFGYLLVLNLFLRTALTMFVVPYLALGFEIAPDYNDRPRLQSIRWVCNMLANFAGPALAWSIFFQDRVAADGTKIPGTSEPDNFAAMGGTFSLAMLALTAIMLWGCRTSARDLRSERPAASEKSYFASFWATFKPIFQDGEARLVLFVVFLLVVGMVISSSVQGYLYVHFLELAGYERTLVHSSTMVASAAGALLAPTLVERFDKRGAMIIGSWCGVGGKIALLIAFFGFGVARTGTSATTLFVIFDGLYWLASGIVLPVATAMIADIGSLAGRRTGRTMDGSYSAVFSLAWRIGVSISLLLAGTLISLVGYDPASTGKATLAVMDRMAAVSFLACASLYIFAIVAARRYRLTRAVYAERLSSATRAGDRTDD